MLISKFKLSWVVLTGGAEGIPPAPLFNMGEDDDKLLDMSNCVFNTSFWIGDTTAGHNLPVGGSCLVPQELHRRLTFLMATGRLSFAGVCLVVCLPVIVGYNAVIYVENFNKKEVSTINLFVFVDNRTSCCLFNICCQYKMIKIIYFFACI